MNRGALDFMLHSCWRCWNMGCWRCCTNPVPMGKQIWTSACGLLLWSEGLLSWYMHPWVVKELLQSAVVLPCISIPAPSKLVETILYNSLGCLHHLHSYVPVPGPLQRSHSSARRSWGKPPPYLSLQWDRTDYFADLKTHLIMITHLLFWGEGGRKKEHYPSVKLPFSVHMQPTVKGFSGTWGLCNEIIPWRNNVKFEPLIFNGCRKNHTCEKRGTFLKAYGDMHG